jgi:hypothetical protein
MVKYYQELTMGEMNRRDKRVTKNLTLSVLYQNIQSVSNKHTELDLVLKLSLKNIEALCFTEHWVEVDYLNLIQTHQYKLVSYFSRKKYDHGGSCVCVYIYIYTHTRHQD